MATPDPLFNENPSLLLGGAVLAAPIFKKLGLGTVLGYLAAGVVIGPNPQADFRSRRMLHVSELGVVFLLFIIGLELKPSRLWQMRGDIFVLGAGQVLFSAFYLCRPCLPCQYCQLARQRDCGLWSCAFLLHAFALQILPITAKPTRFTGGAPSRSFCFRIWPSFRCWRW